MPRKMKRSAVRRRKTTIRRKKRYVRRMNRINVRKYNYRFSAQIPLVGDATGVQFAQMMNYPFWEYSGSGYLLQGNVPPAYIRCTELYSEYVVKGMAVRFIPRYNQNPYGGGGAVGTSSIIVDPRAPNWADSASEAGNYPMQKVWESSRPVSMYVKNKFTRGWFRTLADPTDAIVQGTITPPNPLGALGFNIQTVSVIPEETTIGTLLVTYYITFRGIKTGQVSVAPLAKPELVRQTANQTSTQSQQAPAEEVKAS